MDYRITLALVDLLNEVTKLAKATTKLVEKKVGDG